MTKPRPNTSSPSFDTLAVRGGEPRRHAYDAVTMPIVCTATYGFSGSDEIADYFEGRTSPIWRGRSKPSTRRRNATRRGAILPQ